MAVVFILLMVLACPVRAQGTGGSRNEFLKLNVIGGEDLDVTIDPPDGTDIGELLGVSVFYDAGYTGGRTVVANIENYHPWAGHETLTHVNTFLQPVTLFPPRTDAHPTAVAHLIAGRTPAGGYPHQRGIAPSATLWSSAFGFGSGVAIPTAYQRPMQAGVSGRRADVVNSSWVSQLHDSAASDPVEGVMIDALVAANRTVFVCAAGNTGPDPDTLTTPASGYNNITVGALAGPAYDSPASFSSRGPSDYRNPVTGVTVRGVRATVDIAAPGALLLVADYSTPAPLSNAYRSRQGTSFAAPIVAGGAALLTDAGYDRFGGGASLDGRVIKSVLQNAARPTAGWDNVTRKGADGVWRTRQSLDWAAGAGALDLGRSFTQFTAGTTDLAGIDGGSVHSIGWDLGRAGEGAFTDYYMDAPLEGAFRATLNWWVDRTAVFIPVGGDVNLESAVDNAFVNLDLELWQVTEDGQPIALAAASQSLYNNTELLALTLETSGWYMLRVAWSGKNYDLSGLTDAVDFGLAWWGVPEPAGVTMMMMAWVLAACRRTKSGR